MSRRASGVLLFSSVLACVSAGAWVHAATPRATFPSLSFQPLPPQNGLERKVFGMAVRTPDDDGAFPEREPSVLVAVRTYDGRTSLLRSSTISVRTAKPSTVFGKNRGATKKIAKLQQEALAESLANPTGTAPKAGMPRVAVVPLVNRQLERATSHAMAAALLAKGTVAVMDVEAAERKLADLGLNTALAEGTEVDPPLTDWAAVLGVDVVAGVRVPQVKIARSAEETIDTILAAAVWASGSGSDYGGQVSAKNRQLTYPARGSLSLIVTAGEKLADHLLLWIPEAQEAAVAAGTTLGGGRGVRGVGGIGGGAEGTGIAGVGTRNVSGARGIGGVGGANGGAEGAGIAGVGTTDPSGARGVGGIGGANGGAEGADLARAGTGRVGARRSVSGVGGGYLLSEEAGAVGRIQGGAAGSARDVGGVGGAGSGMENLGLAGVEGSNAGGQRGVGVAMIPGGGMEAVPLATPLVLAVPEQGSVEVSCALPPPAGAAGKAMWIFYHPIDASTMFKDVGRIADLAARAAKGRPDTKVKLTGHACSLGTPEHNKHLAERRAQAVKQRMISLGISPDRILIESEGEDMPVCPNETRVGRMHNRRTEIRLVGGSP